MARSGACLLAAVVGLALATAGHCCLKDSGYPACTDNPPCPHGVYYYCKQGRAVNGCNPNAPFVSADCSQQCVTGGSSGTPGAPPANTMPPPPSSASPGKKGFVWLDSDPRFNDKLNLLRASWAYDWNCNRPASLSQSTPYTPMLWGRTYVENGALMQQLSGLLPGTEQTLLGFNEPDMGGQADMSVAEAISFWPKLIATGRRLGAPATAYDPNAPNSWLSQFMAQAKQLGYRVDFLTVHWYGTPTSAAGILQSLDTLYNTYRLPIWITEFAPADWGASPSNPTPYTPADALSFMQAVVPELIKRPYIERFAWMLADPSDVNRGFGALFQADGITLTDLGRQWASY